MAMFNVVVVGGKLSDTHLVPDCWLFTDYNNTHHHITCDKLMVSPIEIVLEHRL